MQQSSRNKTSTALPQQTKHESRSVQDELHILRQVFGTKQILMNEELEYLRSFHTHDEELVVNNSDTAQTQVNCACGFCFLDYPSEMKRELLSLDNDWADGLVPTSELYWQRRDDIAHRFGFGPVDSNEVMEWEKEEWDV